MFKQNNSARFEIESIKSGFWASFDAFILIIRGITVTAYIKTDLTFTTSAPFSTCKTEINHFSKQNSSTKFATEVIKSGLLDYFDTFILVTGDITVSAYDNTHYAFRICAPLSKCYSELMIFLNKAILLNLKQKV